MQTDLPMNASIGYTLVATGFDKLIERPEIPPGGVFSIGFECGLALANISPNIAARVLSGSIDEKNRLAGRLGESTGDMSGYHIFAMFLINKLKEEGLDVTLN
ncbi:hypothetical protein LCGC14_0882010 [marine sediment metagenome]|uniref:Uncharacterized protein n=1 Tax=marine sediment metagenome TaxID=412755 RepID=A0A0F9MUI8_9ZZZZ